MVQELNGRSPSKRCIGVTSTVQRRGWIMEAVDHRLRRQIEREEKHLVREHVSLNDGTIQKGELDGKE